MKEQVEKDFIEAFKGKNETATSVLRVLKSSIKNTEIEKGSDLTKEEIQDLVNKEAKKRKESITAFEQGGRPELAQQEKNELSVLEKYLPEQLSEEEVTKIITTTINEVGASSLADLGKVMRAAMPKLKGKADGGLINKIVKENLNS